MQTCFCCSNDIDSDAECFLPSSCENCPGTTLKRPVRDVLSGTTAVSGKGLSIRIVASDGASSPDEPVSVSLNEASSFERTSVAQHVDRLTCKSGSFRCMQFCRSDLNLIEFCVLPPSGFPQPSSKGSMAGKKLASGLV